MDTRLATTNIRIQQWTAVFKEKAESGLTVDNTVSRAVFPVMLIITGCEESELPHWKAHRLPL
ncbi:hypothetical protein [Anaerocolumna jejuensis]|uniref:hypothetical protein n=1 Tax=Anaerocolumna jejuensis TaxID=259063 RepID=UPI003F7C0A95